MYVLQYNLEMRRERNGECLLRAMIDSIKWILIARDNTSYLGTIKTR